MNTGTLCNITCRNCYIESSPRNDALAYLTAAELRPYLDEVARDALPVEEIGFTGGEPFLNRDLPQMLEEVLSRGFRALVLTNAMKPMRNHGAALLALRAAHGDRLTLRVSLDHHSALLHDLERQEGSFAQALDGLEWLARQGFRTHVAGRAGFGQEGRRRCGPASRPCSLNTPSRSMPPTRSRSCCSRRWMPAPTCRRSPPPAGASCGSHPIA
ncbi:radical SAM protein [Dankookia sp. P2]|uniref:radical SAM protein n=1 Tax=Dankookia sp. P2 TaxID=3423955 RepID=UPI003D674769